MEENAKIRSLGFSLRLNSVSSIEECLDFFSHRLSHLPIQMEFPLFYRYQFARYMSMKANSVIGLIEGDMVSDLILDAFEEAEEDMENSMVPLTPEGRINMLTQLKICFPCHFDSNDDC